MENLRAFLESAVDGIGLALVVLAILCWTMPAALFGVTP